MRGYGRAAKNIQVRLFILRSKFTVKINVCRIHWAEEMQILLTAGTQKIARMHCLLQTQYVYGSPYWKTFFFSNIVADYVRKLTYFTSNSTRVNAEKHMLGPLLTWPVAGTLGHELATADKVAWQSGDYTGRVGMQTIGFSLLPVPARSSLILCFKKTNLNLQVTQNMCQKLS